MSMKLLKGATFLRTFFEAPRPSKRELEQWVEDGELQGKIIGGQVYVDVNSFIGRAARPERKKTIPDLLG